MVDGQNESQQVGHPPALSTPVGTNQAPPGLSSDDASKAAALIQRNYRGYRERRELDGVGVNAASRRWAEVGFCGVGMR